MRIGRVYKIITSNSNECYIGSTFNELRFRWAGHKKDYGYWKDRKEYKTSSFELFDMYGIENCKIFLIKEYEVVDKRHLEMYEQLWINKLRPINKLSSFRIEWLSNKERYQKVLEMNPNYNKERYQKALQRNPNRGKEKIICECGLEVNKNSHVRHKRTKKHTDRMS